MNPAFVLMRCRAGPGVCGGQTPIVAVPGKRQSVSAASTVNAKGAFWFATYKGGMSADLFVAMLKQIMRRRRKPLFLVIDSLPAHKAKLVRDYVEATDGNLKLYFLPGYAPELNPDELVWSHMNRTGTAKRPLASNELLQERIEADLIGIQNNRASSDLSSRLLMSPILLTGEIIGRPSSSCESIVSPTTNLPMQN
jgi:transposase